MILFRDLNGTELARCPRDAVKDFQTLRDAARKALDVAQDVRMYFVDVEGDVAQVTDQDDFEYAAAQAQDHLMVVLVDLESTLKGATLVEAVKAATQAKIPEEKETISDVPAPETNPVGVGIVENRIKEEVRGMPETTESPKEPVLEAAKIEDRSQRTLEPNQTQKKPEVTVMPPKKEAQEVGTLLSSLHGTLQENFKELVQNLAASSTSTPHHSAPRPTPPASRKSPSGRLESFTPCSHCKQIIRGRRFKCMQCANTHFCSTCEALVSHPHTMIRFCELDDEKAIDTLSRVYQLKQRLAEMSDDELRKAVIRKVTNANYPDEFYEQFVHKNRNLTFGAFVNKVVSIFE